jgi:uncharacterized membrane protein
VAGGGGLERRLCFARSPSRRRIGAAASPRRGGTADLNLSAGEIASWRSIRASSRAVHVVAVVIWLGGVWLVTTVLLPAMHDKPADQWLGEFEAIEQRFAPQARIAALAVLLSGLYMLYAYDLWGRFADRHFWWMHLMVGVWLLFAALLFVIEPLLIRRIVRRRAAGASRAADLKLRLHGSC